MGRPGRSRNLVKIAASAVAGAALALGHPPTALPLAPPIAVALLTWAAYQAGAARGAFLGAISGALYLGLMTSWVSIFGVDAFLALLAIGTGWFALMGAGLALASRLPLWPIASALTWSLQELLFARAPFGGFPWGRLAYSQVESPAANLTSVLSVAGLSFLVALSGTTLTYCALLLERSKTIRQRLSALGGALACLVLPLSGILITVDGNGQTGQGPVHAQVAIVQGGPDTLGLDPYTTAQERIKRYSELTQNLARNISSGQSQKPDLVIWPENSANLDPYTNEEARHIVDQAVDTVRTPVLVGAVTVANSKDAMENRAALWRPGQGPTDHYTKTRPVPFGEYLPGRAIFDYVAGAWPWLGQRFAWLEKDFTSGDKVGAMLVDKVNVGIAICFEVAYDQVMRQTVQEGSRLLVVPTNNAIWSGSAGVDQQFAIARLRAIEHNRTVVAAATTGITAIVDPSGRVLARLEPDSEGVLEGKVALRDSLTVATRYGALIEMVLILLGLAVAGSAVCLAAKRRIQRKSRDKNHETSAKQ